MPVLQLYEYQENDAFTDMLQYYSDDQWNAFYERLQNRSTLSSDDASCEAARAIKNRPKNRYRNISPYDSNRVYLQSLPDNDYINASFVSISEVPSRCYILTQGPMLHTISHFWLMVWERRSPAIIMLNGMLEKGNVGLYIPEKLGHPSLVFADVNLIVHLESETVTPNFIRRTFLLVHSKTNDQHRLLHLHYTKWPDFGLPASPGALLNFLWTVRATGCLDSPERPTVIHCSAGVGRSGCFVLIDLALLLVEKAEALQGLDLAGLLVRLRRCRMGLIQTADQLRFCYSAVLLGGRLLLAAEPQHRAAIDFEEGQAESNSSPEPNQEEGDSSRSSLSDDLDFRAVTSASDEEVDGDGPTVEPVTLATMDKDSGDDDDDQQAQMEGVAAANWGANPVGSTLNSGLAGRPALHRAGDAVSRETLSVGLGPGVELRQHDYKAMEGELPPDFMPLLLPVSTAAAAAPDEDGTGVGEGSGEEAPHDGETEKSATGGRRPKESDEKLTEPTPELWHLVAASQQEEMRQRRATRHLRHLRNEDRTRALRQQLRAAGLERRRWWLPDWLRGPLAWFYSRSGLVCCARDAVVATSLLATAFLASCYAVRHYFYSR